MRHYNQQPVAMLRGLRSKFDVKDGADESYNAKHWHIMAGFQSFNLCYSYKIDWMWLTICKALLMKYVLLFIN